MPRQQKAESATTNIKVRFRSRDALNRKRQELKKLLKRRSVSQSDAIDWLVMFHDTNDIPAISEIKEYQFNGRRYLSINGEVYVHDDKGLLKRLEGN